jgi:hypothetical protein
MPLPMNTRSMIGSYKALEALFIDDAISILQLEVTIAWKREEFLGKDIRKCG